MRERFGLRFDFFGEVRRVLGSICEPGVERCVSWENIQFSPAGGFRRLTVCSSIEFHHEFSASCINFAHCRNVCESAFLFENDCALLLSLSKKTCIRIAFLYFRSLSLCM